MYDYTFVYPLCYQGGIENFQVLSIKNKDEMNLLEHVFIDNLIIIICK